MVLLDIVFDVKQITTILENYANIARYRKNIINKDSQHENKPVIPEIMNFDSTFVLHLVLSSSNKKARRIPATPTGVP
ncbi:hypothetical protein DRP04_14650 [Archaeoglobales archaeon]|nr:MAG: hypothetical protein B6U96_13895 [Archaeoglobales archaeon ex4484_92]RLI74457.1 MAG: hypothetical protein DRP04_14650 [Archaeoglobales archaeon]